LNSGNFYSPFVYINYYMPDSPNNTRTMHYIRSPGPVSGTLSGGSFSLSLINPAADISVYYEDENLNSYTSVPTAAVLTGTFDSSDPNVGSLVTGGNVDITLATPIAGMTTNFPIQDGTVSLK
jgi:hypothetical protein